MPGGRRSAASLRSVEQTVASGGYKRAVLDGRLCVRDRNVLSGMGPAPGRARFSIGRNCQTNGPMMRFTRTALLLALALAASVRAVAAQTIPSPYRHIEQTQSVGVFGGYMFSDPDIGLTDSTSLPIGPRSGPLFGARYQVRASGPLSVEGSIGVNLTDRRLFGVVTRADSSIGDAVDLETTVPATLLMADVGLRFHLTGARTWNGLAPFVVGTGGLAADMRGTFEEEEDVRDEALYRLGPSFAVGAGLGTDWFPASNASIRIEAGARLMRMETPNAFLGNDPNAERSEWNPAVSISVGGAFHF
jgi:hypothetical protein